MSVFASQSIIRSIVSRVMISLRLGPAFTWQCVQVRLQSLPTLTWRISGRTRRSEIECSVSFRANLFIPRESVATTAIAALVCFRGDVVMLAFGLFRMPQRSTRAIEWLRLGRRYIDNRIDQFEKLTIRSFL